MKIGHKLITKIQNLKYFAQAKPKYLWKLKLQYYASQKGLTQNVLGWFTKKAGKFKLHISNLLKDGLDFTRLLYMQ